MNKAKSIDDVLSEFDDWNTGMSSERKREMKEEIRSWYASAILYAVENYLPKEDQLNYTDCCDAAAARDWNNCIDETRTTFKLLANRVSEGEYPGAARDAIKDMQHRN